MLDEVIERATARHEAQRELEGKTLPRFRYLVQLLGLRICVTKMSGDLSQGVESPNPLEAVRSLRKIRRERLQKDLFLKAKDAKLRSGARGMQARKAPNSRGKDVLRLRCIVRFNRAAKPSKLDSW